MCRPAGSEPSTWKLARRASCRGGSSPPSRRGSPRCPEGTPPSSAIPPPLRSSWGAPAWKELHQGANLDPPALTIELLRLGGGGRHEDIVTDPWRYFQYEYTARLLGSEFFAREVAIPSIHITYNIVSTSGETAEREHT